MVALVFGVIALALSLDAWRARQRLRFWLVQSAAAEGALVRSGAGDPEVESAVWTTAGAALSSDVLARVRRLVAASGAPIVELLPERAPARAWFGFAMLTRPAHELLGPFRPARSLGFGVALDPKATSMATGALPAGKDPDGLRPCDVARIVTEVTSSARADMTYLPMLVPAETRVVAYDDPAFLDEVAPFGRFAVLAGTPILLGALATFAGLGIAAGAGAWSFAPVVAYQLQPAIALARTGVHAPGLSLLVLARPMVELAAWARLVTRARRDEAASSRGETVAAARLAYERDLADGTRSFFAPALGRCPACDTPTLAPFLSMPDRLQGKPGRFSLSRCATCASVFQDPPLNARGLAFYYADFYDGLGEKVMRGVFAHDEGTYRRRAKALVARVRPSRWLDVGCGEGHFAAALRPVLPHCRFEGLDFGDGALRGARRGFLDRAYRGTLPEHVATRDETYDVVSLFHCLEHVPSPDDELTAAWSALAPGGHLLIEVPDPTCALGRVLRTFWLPWFQPQHVHLFSPAALTRLLERHGFEVILVDRAAHEPVDLGYGVLLALASIARPGNVPWRRPRGAPARLGAAVTWSLGLPLVGLARLADRALSRGLVRAGVSNAYRVIAQRPPEAEGEAA